jgi:spore coat protein CotF
MGVFLITWFSSYDLMKNQNISIKISNQKQQVIQIIDEEKMASPKQGENDTKIAEVEKSTAKITI